MNVNIPTIAKMLNIMVVKLNGFTVFIIYLFIYLFIYLLIDLQYNDELASGICSTPDSIQACYKLLNALCVGVKENIEILSDLLSDIFYNGGLLLVVMVVLLGLIMSSEITLLLNALKGLITLFPYKIRCDILQPLPRTGNSISVNLLATLIFRRCTLSRIETFSTV